MRCLPPLLHFPCRREERPFLYNGKYSSWSDKQIPPSLIRVIKLPAAPTKQIQHDVSNTRSRPAPSPQQSAEAAQIYSICFYEDGRCEKL